MACKKLKRDFFNRPTLIVAKELLGKFLVRKIGGRQIAVMITETEAYFSLNDLASHASRGRMPRNEVMFGPAGLAYVYLIYGMYYCLNIVTEKENYPAAVLIRGVKLTARKSKNRKLLGTSRYPLAANLDGPGKLCRWLKIDKELNKEDLTISKRLWLEDRGIKIPARKIKRTKRIGVDYAGKYKDKLWRFVMGL